MEDYKIIGIKEPIETSDLYARMFRTWDSDNYGIPQLGKPFKGSEQCIMLPASRNFIITCKPVVTEDTNESQIILSVCKPDGKVAYVINQIVLDKAPVMDVIIETMFMSEPLERVTARFKSLEMMFKEMVRVLTVYDLV